MEYFMQIYIDMTWIFLLRPFPVAITKTTRRNAKIYNNIKPDNSLFYNIKIIKIQFYDTCHNLWILEMF